MGFEGIPEGGVEVLGVVHLQSRDGDVRRPERPPQMRRAGRPVLALRRVVPAFTFRVQRSAFRGSVLALRWVVYVRGSAFTFGVQRSAFRGYGLMI